MTTVIHHNPNCGTSRNVLAILQATGVAPTVIHYLDTGWTKPQLHALFAAAGLTPKTALRTHKTNAIELGLPDADDADILDAMVNDPVLVNRPIVCSSKGVALCRPSETVMPLLEHPANGPLHKEDGTMILDAAGNHTSS